MPKKRGKTPIDPTIEPERLGEGDQVRDRIKKRKLAEVVHCVCPNCGAKMPNQAEIPCDLIQCPKCGSPMRRE